MFKLLSTLALASTAVAQHLVGRVCGATGNFTTVLLSNPDGTPWIWTESLYVTVNGANGDTSSGRINEIYPIYRDDLKPILNPADSSAGCSAATDPVPTLEPTFPDRPEVKLNRWSTNYLNTPNSGYEYSYIKSAAGGFITDYEIMCQKDGENHVVAKVENAISDFTLARFVAEDGTFGAYTCWDEFFLTVIYWVDGCEWQGGD
ncbi:hypothetical protein B0T17DRAFT_509264 [Bombardia bombarda]|uniref:Uncharacterized protein n=1 Tax=Bombardia bombarda TaxID=252184 RepID=A0AA39WUR3_9PEZI|nr:hypothetical protein B0T17DRAFT_509264 [Bombardia bombarda]